MRTVSAESMRSPTESQRIYTLLLMDTEQPLHLARINRMFQIANIRTAPTIDQLERASRMYRNNADAARALGVHPQTVSRLFKKHGIKARWKKGTRSYD